MNLPHCLRRVALALLLGGLACAALAQPAEARRDADAIKTRFARWIEPPPVQLSVAGLPQREAGDAMRRVVRQQHDAAVDPLLELTGAPSPDATERAPAGGRTTPAQQPAQADVGAADTARVRATGRWIPARARGRG